MKTGLHYVKKILKRTFCFWIGLSYAPVFFAASTWFPKVPAADDMTNGANSMTVTGSYVKKGMELLLFVVAVGMFVKFIGTVQHGIEEAKKSENGSVTVFATYSVMAIVYLAVSISAGYLGYSVVTKFTI